MSETEEYLFEHSSCDSLRSVTCVGNAQTMTETSEQTEIHLQHANLFLEDPTSSESSWTNEKHSLYLNSMEEGFVSSLYQKGDYTYPCKRWQTDRREIASVFSLDLNEEVESGFSNGQVLFGFPEESQSESDPEKPTIYRDVQNYSEKCRLKEICVSNGRRNKRKLQLGVADPDREITDVFEEVQSKHNEECASNFYTGQNRFAYNTTVSETLVKTSVTTRRIRSFHPLMRHLPRKIGKPR